MSALSDAVAELSECAWALAAVCTALDSGLAAELARPGTARELAHRAGLADDVAERTLEVLEALGLAERDRDTWSGAELAAELGPRERFVRADARNALLQAGDIAGRVASGHLHAGWAHTDPQLLETQGVMSAAAVDPLVRFVFPTLEGLEDRLSSPGGAFLDVGAGVAEIGVELCRYYPELRVVGLEPAAAPRVLAGAKIQAAGLAGRIEMRDLRVEELADDAAFDLAWLALPFLPPVVTYAAIRAVHRALRPGGWLLVGTLGSPARGDLGDALAAFRSVLWGGGPLAPETVEELLAGAGFAGVRTFPRTPARMTPLVARRP